MWNDTLFYWHYNFAILTANWSAYKKTYTERKKVVFQSISIDSVLCCFDHLIIKNDCNFIGISEKNSDWNKNRKIFLKKKHKKIFINFFLFVYCRCCFWCFSINSIFLFAISLRPVTADCLSVSFASSIGNIQSVEYIFAAAVVAAACFSHFRILVVVVVVDNNQRTNQPTNQAL